MEAPYSGTQSLPNWKKLCTQCTSTCGLIALGLASRIAAATICEFYEQKGPAIFKGAQGRLARLRQTLIVLQ